ncbi:MAG TPA: helix-hairpin-helix domain-containing protein [Thermoplasmata archaeon]|nr:helix-hairpin-helix domain-containing protein [Thermoplasmata archaeon]
MATKGRGQETATCTVCGGELNASGECTICGTKHDANGRALPSVRELGVEEAVEQFTQISGVGESKARALFEQGYTSLEALQAASVDELARVPGLGDKLARQIHEMVPKMIASRPAAAAAPANGGTNGSNGLQRWLKGEDQGLNTWLGSPAPVPGQDEALRRWLTGEEDALGQWLGEAQAAGKPVAAGDVDRRLRDNQRLLDERERQLRDKEIEIDGLHAELDSIKRTMSQELDQFKSGAFDPMKYVEETARLNKELQTEIKQRRQLSEEIDHIKKGSIAVIKYMKTQQMKTGASSEVKKKLGIESAARRKLEIDLKKTQEVLASVQKQVEAGLAKMRPDERALKQRELALADKEATLRAKEAELGTLEEAARRGDVDLNGGGVSEELRSRMQEELREKEAEYESKQEELKRRVIALDEEVSRYRIEDEMRKEAEALAGKPKGEIDAVLAAKERSVLDKEKSIKLREQRIQQLETDNQILKDDMQRLKQLVGTKDDELGRREEDLLYREKILQGEMRKIEQAKAEGFSTEEKDLKDRLEQLKADINQKEEEVRAKEKFLKSKMEELRLREQGLIDEDMEAREEERMLEVKQEKVHTGSPRLDDLLLGGIPFGSNVSIYGPAYVGKEVIVNAFMAEGLKKGIPAVFVITDKTPGDIREEMTYVLPGYDVYEQKGLVKYVDAYSRSMGSTDTDPYTAYVQDPTDHDAILKTTDEVTKELKKKHEYYRLCFRSISTLIAYLDPTTTFKFLQPFSGRRKRDKAVCMYLLEKGMHGEQEIQMLGSVMDGTIEIKVEQLKSFLCVKGISDVQSRAWIRYTYSKSAVNIGSFSLDHIR